MDFDRMAGWARRGQRTKEDSVPEDQGRSVSSPTSCMIESGAGRSAFGIQGITPSRC